MAAAGQGRGLPAGAVVAEPGAVVVADAGGEDQPVVLQGPLVGEHLAPVPVHAADFGLEEGVAEAAGHLAVVEAQGGAIRLAHQPVVAAGAGPEGGQPFQQFHFQLGRLLAQMAGGGEAAPAAADDEHPAALARDGCRGGSPHQGHGAEGAQGGGGSEEVTAARLHGS